MQFTHFFRAIVFLTLLYGVAPKPIFAQSSATVSELLEEIKSLRKDIQKLSDALSTQSPSLPAITPVGPSKIQGVPVEYITLPFMPEWVSGDPHQKSVVVEFADLQCPFCSYFNNKIAPSFRQAM